MFFNNKCCQGQSWFEQQGCCCEADPCKNDPIYEQPVEKCVTREICHEVNHICPVHTRIINNHIIRHNYTPEYTCSEENVITNIDPGCCPRS